MFFEFDDRPFLEALRAELPGLLVRRIPPGAPARFRDQVLNQARASDRVMLVNPHFFPNFTGAAGQGEVVL